MSSENKLKASITKIKEGITLNLDTLDFLNFIKENSIFVDKTLFIRDILEKKLGFKVIFFKRFSTTLNQTSLF